MKYLYLLIFSILLISTTVSVASGSKCINGQIERVIDGDTLVVNDNGITHRIRLYGVDCPETLRKGYWSTQPFAAKSKAFSVGFAGKQAMVIVHGKGYFGRLIGEIFVDGRSLNRELIRNGLAWWAKDYAPKDLDLKRLENNARKLRIGIWSQQNPISPWTHRKNSDLRKSK